jgi:hypothetical protein
MTNRINLGKNKSFVHSLALTVFAPQKMLIPDKSSIRVLRLTADIYIRYFLCT